jgi:hypothetical protein
MAFFAKSANWRRKFSAILLWPYSSRQCLGSRRISDLKTLRREAKAWNRRMNRDCIKINWKFDRRAARRKFGYKRKSFMRNAAPADFLKQ